METASILDAESFRRSWPGPLVRLAAGHPGVPSGALEFLSAAGLPAQLTWGPAELTSVLSFERLAHPLVTVAEEMRAPPGSAPEPWARYLVIGEERFANGTALWSLDPEGAVRRVDVE